MLPLTLSSSSVRESKLQQPTRITIRRIGNKDDAERASRGQMRLIGEGAFRKVFVNDDNSLVYKVCNDRNKCQDDCNLEEQECYRDMVARGYSCMVETCGWMVNGQVVNCQPYLNGAVDVAKREQLMQALDGFIFDIRYYDGGNIAFTANGTPLVVDLQYFDPQGKGRMIERLVR